MSIFSRSSELERLPNLQIILGDTPITTQLLLNDKPASGAIKVTVLADCNDVYNTAEVTFLLNHLEECQPERVRLVVGKDPDHTHVFIDGEELHGIIHLKMEIDPDKFTMFLVVKVLLKNTIVTPVSTCKQTNKRVKLPSCICEPELPVFSNQVGYKEKGLYELLVTAAEREQVLLEKKVPDHETSVNQAKIDAFRKPGEVFIKEPLKQSDLTTIHYNRVQTKPRYKSWKTK